MCQYQYVRLFWDIFLALLEKNYKLCCWVLRGSVENSSWGQLLPISRAMSNYEGGATQAALLPHVTPATPSGCCGQQPNAVSCFLRLTLKWMGVTRLAFIVRVNPYWGKGCVLHSWLKSLNKHQVITMLRFRCHRFTGQAHCSNSNQEPIRMKHRVSDG